MGWYYPPPQPTQLAPHVVQASTGQNPPIKSLAAAAAAIISLWPISYDHSAYAQDFRAKQTAPLTLAYGQSPPTRSLASFYEQRSQWADLTWSEQSASAIAGLLPAVSNPPFALRVPLEAKDPQRLYYGDGAQYGFRYQANAPSGAVVTPVVNAPNPLQLAAIVSAVRSAWPDTTWPVQTYPDSVAPLPSPAVPAPPIGPLALDSAINSWPAIVWSAQSTPDNIVQPYPGDEPPGSFSVPDIAAYIPPDWRAQSASPSAGWNVPPAPSAFTPIRRPPYDVLAWWLPTTWSAQTQSDVQPLAAIIYGSQPPPSSSATQSSIRSLWTDTTWPAQTQPDVAEIVPPPVVNNPQPSSYAALYAIRAIWVDAAWSVQTQPDIAGIAPPPPVVNNPQPSSYAALYALRATWANITWGAQTQSDLPQLPAVAIPWQPAPQIAALVAIRASWLEVTWSTQSAPDTVSLIARVDAPPPSSLAGKYAIRGIWSDAVWSAQSAYAPIAPLTLRYGMAPPRLNPYAIYAVRLTWSDPIWSSQSATPAAATVPIPVFMLVAPARLELADYGASLVLDDYGPRLIL